MENEPQILPSDPPSVDVPSQVHTAEPSLDENDTVVESRSTEDAGSPESAPLPDSAAVMRHLERIEEHLADHLRSTEAFSRQAFDKLYGEMQDYKRNFLRQAQNPLLQDLMLLYDSIETLCQTYAGASTVDAANLCSNLRSLQVEAEEILIRSGVERMLTTPDRLDVRLQQAVKTVPTDDPEEDLTVVERLKAGFLSDEKAVRKERVVVKKWRRPSAPRGSA